MNPKEILIKYLEKWHQIERKGKSFLKINSTAFLYLRSSKNLNASKQIQGKFYFGITQSELEKYSNENVFIVCICELSEKKTDYIVFSQKDFNKIKEKIKVTSGQWKLNIFKENDNNYYLKLTGLEKINITEYIDYFDITPQELKQKFVPTLNILEKKDDDSDENIEVEDSLIHRIKRYSKDSENSYYFEEVIAEYFSKLGFISEKIGGSGNTDILIKEPYKFIIDTKSTKLPSINKVNFTRIKRHREMNDAKYMIIIADKFQKAVIQDAIMENACLLTVEILEKLYYLNQKRCFSPFELEIIFSKIGLINEDDLEYLLENTYRENEFLDSVRNVIKNMDFNFKSFDEIKGRIDFYCESHLQLKVPKEKILKILEFLNNDFLQIVKKENEKYRINYLFQNAILKINNLFNFNKIDYNKMNTFENYFKLKCPKCKEIFGVAGDFWGVVTCPYCSEYVEG